MWNTAKPWPLKSSPPVLLFISASRQSSSLVALSVCVSRGFCSSIRLTKTHRSTCFFVLTPSVRGKTLLLLLIFLSSLFLFSTECVSAYSIKLKRWDQGCRPMSQTALFLVSQSLPPLKSSFPCLLSCKTGSLADWWTASPYSVRCPFLLSCRFLRLLLMYNPLISSTLVNT